MTASELEAVSITVEGLRDELRRCPATPAGYREASYLRSRIAAHERYRASEAADLG